MNAALTLEDFAALPLVAMARDLSELPEIKPCRLCAELERPCLVHRQEMDWHRAIAGVQP